MVVALGRLVRRLQSRLQSVGPGAEFVELPLADVHELQTRVSRLRKLGRPFRHVRLSRYVRIDDRHGVSVRIGGLQSPGKRDNP